MKTTTRFNPLRRGQNMLLRHWKTALATALCAAACSHLGLAQVAAPSILQIDIANHVLYFNGTSDVANYGTDTNVEAQRQVSPAANLRRISSARLNPSLAQAGGEEGARKSDRH